MKPPFLPESNPIKPKALFTNILLSIAAGLVIPNAINYFFYKEISLLPIFPFPFITTIVTMIFLGIPRRKDKSD